MDTFMDKLASKLNAQEMIRANSAAEAKENERLHKEVEVYKQCLQEMREISMQNAATADEVAELVKASMDKIAAIQAESGKSDDVIAAMQSKSDDMIVAIQSKSDDMIVAIQSKSDDMIAAVKNNSDVMLSSMKGALQTNANTVMNAIEGSSDKILAELQAGNDGFKDALKNELMAEIKKELKVQEENVHKECVKVYRNVQAVVTEETEKQTDEIIGSQAKNSKKATAALVCGILAMSFAALGLIVSVLDVLGVFSMIF